MAIRIAEEWLATCGGCEVTLLDVGEPLLDVLPQLKFVHIPVLMDHKYSGQMGEKPGTIEIPEADIGILSGGIRNEENRKIAEEMRKKVNTLIAVGACANFGGIPALANMYTMEEIINMVYKETETTDPANLPTNELPKLEERVFAVSEVVKVDVALPGCPTTPEIYASAILSLLKGEKFELPERSVCDDCPLKREKKAVANLKRPLEKPDFPVNQPLESIRCLMEQGYLCLGPVTHSGCGGSEKTPRCIKAHMPCRGCFGMIRNNANPMVDMMSALSSIGINPQQIEDRRAFFNRFIGASGRLRPIKSK